MESLNTLKNKIILFENSLYIVEDVRQDLGIMLVSKLESDSEIIELDLTILNAMDVSFIEARELVVNIMNQVRYFDNVLSKERKNVVM